MTEQQIPEQPDGITDDSHDLPDPARAADRVNEFLAAWGDGLIPLEFSGTPPLYARDLQALANLCSAEQTYEWGFSYSLRDGEWIAPCKDEERARSEVERLCNSRTLVRRLVGPWATVTEANE